MAVKKISGTRVSGCGIFSVVSKGPMTGMAGTTQANGYFAAFLKFSGFEGIIVQGRAKRWLYFHVHDGPAKGRGIMSQWEALRRNYYQHMGWDLEMGRPLPETLEKLDLGHLLPDLNKV
jgi:aldehyde:ferredoxin oxidoreductase